MDKKWKICYILGGIVTTYLFVLSIGYLKVTDEFYEAVDEYYEAIDCLRDGKYVEAQAHREKADEIKENAKELHAFMKKIDIGSYFRTEEEQ